MTTERRIVFEPRDITALRIQCTKCRCEVVPRPDSDRNIPYECPSGMHGWSPMEPRVERNPVRSIRFPRQYRDRPVRMLLELSSDPPEGNRQHPSTGHWYQQPQMAAASMNRPLASPSTASAALSSFFRAGLILSSSISALPGLSPRGQGGRHTSRSRVPRRCSTKRCKGHPRSAHRLQADPL